MPAAMAEPVSIRPSPPNAAPPAALRPTHTRYWVIMRMSTRLGGAFTPLLVYLCLQHVTWRAAFLLFGLPGVVWAILFYRWYRDDPRSHPSVNAA